MPYDIPKRSSFNLFVVILSVAFDCKKYWIILFEFEFETHYKCIYAQFRGHNRMALSYALFNTVFIAVIDRKALTDSHYSIRPDRELFLKFICHCTIYSK